MVDLMYGGKKNGQKQISASGRNYSLLNPAVKKILKNDVRY
jgi:hypothetical protein